MGELVLQQKNFDLFIEKLTFCHYKWFAEKQMLKSSVAKKQMLKSSIAEKQMPIYSVAMEQAPFSALYGVSSNKRRVTCCLKTAADSPFCCINVCHALGGTRTLHFHFHY